MTVQQPNLSDSLSAPQQQFHPQAGGRGLCVFIHGFFGSPRQMEDLAELAFQAGYSTLNLLLPGHGGSERDFAAATAEQWQLHVENAIIAHAEPGEDIYLVGHSMGGLLALQAALGFPTAVRGCLLLSTPLRLNVLQPRSLLYRAKFVLLPPDDEIKATYLYGRGVEYAKWWLYPLWLKPLRQLQGLMRRTEQRLPEVSCPVTLFHSRVDETVALASAELLYQGLGSSHKKSVKLASSWHAWYEPAERRLITDELLRMLAGE